MPGFRELGEMVDDFVKGEEVNLFTDIFFTENPKPEKVGGFTPRSTVTWKNGWAKIRRVRMRSSWWAVRLVMIVWTAAFLVGLPYIAYLLATAYGDTPASEVIKLWLK